MGMITNDWLSVVEIEMKKEYYKKLYQFLKKEYSEFPVYPLSENIFNAFHYTSLKDVKVVILGQDPYHEWGQAEGLSFSVPKGVRIPPSLLNIYKELKTDLDIKIPSHGHLKKWADQGVLLLNTVLTVRGGEAFSHREKGWESFTDAVMRAINEEDRPIAFLLWGKAAKEKAKMLNNPKHLILTAPHPSPLSASRGFFGCKHFSKVNAFLKENGLKEIDWQIED